MHDYKLVVVSPFNDYQRGDQILDSNIVKKILDTNDVMHEHENKCRRVLKSAIEKQQYVAPIPANLSQQQSPQINELQNIEVESAPIHIESINASDDAEIA